MPTPRQILSDCVDMEVGDNFIIALKSSGIACLIGNCPFRESSSARDDTHDWVEISSIPQVTQVVACSSTAMLLTEDGTLFSVGEATTNGQGEDATEFRRVDIPPIGFVALGSRHAAAITLNRDSLFVWGDGLSGCLGLGRRIRLVPTPTECIFFREMGVALQSVACTRGQPHPKRVMKPFESGQEGARTHVVPVDGTLWIAGTSHKGLACDHLYKVMNPKLDHLNFYRVGSCAADCDIRGAPTGACEDLSVNPHLAAARLGMADASLLGERSQTNYFSNCRIVSTSVSHIHSLALSADGQLFAWGCGSDGRTGLLAYMRGPGGSKRTLKCYVSSPSRIEALEDKSVLSMAVGRYWSFAIVAGEDS